MKKIPIYFLSILFMILSLDFSMINVYAQGENKLSLVAYDCNQLDEGLECLGPNGNIEEDLTEFLDNADVEPGKIIQLDVYYVPGEITDVSMQIGIKYDKTLVEPVYDGEEVYVLTDMSTIYQGGIWPAAGTSTTNKKKTNWDVQANDVIDRGMIKLLISDNAVKDELVTEGVLASLFFKVKDDAVAGSVINFSYDDTFTNLAKKSPLLLSGFNFNVYGQKSNNKALETLSVSSNNTTYPLTPVFVAGSTDVKEYSTVVANQVTNIDITATTSDSSSMISSGTGNRPLNVGDNTFNIIVTAQNGETETYKVKVYRLSNDATLKTLSLSNQVDIGTFSPSVLNYTALVPYSTSSITISATKNHENATIDSGTGEWNLSNYGTTINTKEVIVRAENCLDKYSVVEGNTCSENKYKIDITRTAPSTNADLSSLTVDGVSVPNFSSGITAYNLPNVINSKSKLNIDATVSDIGKAKITSTLGDKDLSIGDNVINIVVQAEDGTTTKTYTINIRRLSNDNKLSSLTVTSTPLGTLSPAFSSAFMDYYTYTAPSTVSKVSIGATVSDTGKAQIISGLGEFDIDDNPYVNVTVQAEDGSQSIYVVKLIRSKSANNYLKSLSIDGYSLNKEFVKTDTLYTANVAGDVSSINISAEVEDIGKARIISGTGTHNLNVGINTIQVRVESENGSTKDYTITVTRAPKAVSVLTDLTVDGVSIPGFKEDTQEYTLSNVPFTKTSVLIGATKKDADSTIVGTGTVDLSTGENTLYVTVTAQDGTAQTSYAINIYREKDSNADLSDLKINGTTIKDFNKNDTEYDLNVDNSVKQLNLVVQAESKSATVIVSDNSNFSTEKINPVKITVTAEDGTIKIYTINVNRDKSVNNYLKSIILSDGLLDPVFNKETQKYTVNVDRSVTSITITPQVEDKTATAVVTGPSTLIIGENIFEIIVTNEKKVNDRVYEIIVNRNASSNNYLSNLTIDGTTVKDFSKEKELYTISVPSTKDNITLGTQVDENHASTIIRKQGDTSTTITTSNTFDLTTGVNSFEIIVIAENNMTRTYSVIITKERSSDSSLSNLSIAQTTISPTFKSDVISYTASVAYTVTSIDIIATKSSATSTVIGDGNKNLNTGENTFNIVVTAEDNTTTTYKIVVTREKNNNANLSNLVVSGGFVLKPNFNRDETEYALTVPNSTESVTITAYKEDPNAKSITGDGLIKLNTGVNSISIVVTAEDGVTTKTYNVEITRQKSNDASLKSIIVSDGILTPIFDSKTKEYEVTVQNEITDLTITALPTSKSATAIVSGNTGLIVGTNNATITVTAEDGTISYYNIKILRQPSSNNFLRVLSVKDKNNKEYIETFVNTKLEYNITVENDIDSITLYSEKDDLTSVSTGGNSTEPLQIGINSFEVSVTSAASIERVYTINITRKANSNAFLSSLEVVGQILSPEFNKNTIGYTVSVPSTIDKITINATAEVNTSTVTGTGEHSLQTGVNNFNIDVTSEDASVRTYVIVVNKEASDNNYLSNLSVTPGVLIPVFNKETQKYSIHVDNETTMLNITADKEHSSATVTGDGIKALSVGTQKFEIVVKAENNTPRTYEISVTRDASSNKDLSDLTINGTTLQGFNKDVLEYTLNVDNSVNSIEIGATKVDETATVTGIGNINLNTGLNTISITVTAEDGTFKIYDIKVTRAESSNNYLSKLNISEGTISPEFNKEITAYVITVPYEVTNLTIDAVPEDKAAKIEIDSNNNFIVGSNKVMINVVAEDKTVRPYEIIVTRQQQANNFITSMVIEGNDKVRYSLDPVFDKFTYTYDVSLPSTVTSINIITTKEASSLTVEGDGIIQINSLPQIQKVKVKTTGGLERTYTIRFKKGLSSNTKLKNITLSEGELSPIFNENEDVYLVKLPSGTKSITINAEKSEPEQIITGDGLIDLKSGDNRVDIMVTSENGNTKIYRIIIDVGKTQADPLESITVNKGVLTPEFNKDTKYYSVNLDDTEEDITIDATGSNTIIGTGTFNLQKGANTFEVKSVDTDGLENIYTIVVNRGNVNSKYLSLLKVEGNELDKEFNKEEYNYSLKLSNLISQLNIIAIPENKDATVTITGNTNLKIGDNTISIKVIDPLEGELTYTIIVTIGQNKIISNIHTIDEKYITTIKENKTASSVKSEMTNPDEQLKIYNLSGVEISDKDIVCSGFIIKLEVNGTVYDSKTLIIKGDINSNGEVEVGDLIMLKRGVLETLKLNDYELVSSDINNDNDPTIADLIIIKRHILQNMNIFELGE